MIKRVCDVVASAAGLAVLWPLFVIVAVLIKLESNGPVLFRQSRVGRHFAPFRIYKFRTMVSDAERRGAQITVGCDRRVTRIGVLLRRTKVDELPQLINVLKGDMSLVGPRPEVPAYVGRFLDDFEEILKVRPGITDLASLKYHDEGAVLAAHAARAEEYYLGVILPDKIRLARQYLAHASLWLDLQIILRTLGSIVGLEKRSVGQIASARR